MDEQIYLKNNEFHCRLLLTIQKSLTPFNPTLTNHVNHNLLIRIIANEQVYFAEEFPRGRGFEVDLKLCDPAGCQVHERRVGDLP